MAHFALLDENNTVVQVCVVDNSNAPGDYPLSDIAGKQYLFECGFKGTWVQTSYNNNFRKQYAGIGYYFDSTADVFIAPKPFPSWTLDINYDWQPPVRKPDGVNVYWDEERQGWFGLSGIPRDFQSQVVHLGE